MRTPAFLDCGEDRPRARAEIGAQDRFELLRERLGAIDVAGA